MKLLAAEPVGDGEGERFGERELQAGLYECGVEDKGEGEVFVAVGLPLVAALADAVGLAAGPNDRELPDLRQVAEALPVGPRCEVEESLFCT